MRSSRYFNAILTVNAALLAGVACLELAGGGGFAAEADAQVRTRYATRTPGIPNAAAQRAEIAQRLRAVEAAVQRTNSLLESGRIRVSVTNLNEIRLED